MARYRRGKKSLYEVMTKVRHKQGYGKTLEKLRPGKSDEYKTTEEKSDVQAPVFDPEAQTRRVPGITAKWWRKPRMVQFNVGRIEFSMSYPIATAIVLGIILLILLAFRAGQYSSFLHKESIGLSKVEGMTEGRGQKPALSKPVLSSIEGVEGTDDTTETKVEPAKPTGGLATGGNVIVLVEYAKRADLVPVQRHFAQFGIETEIVSWAGKYFLITKDRFESFGISSDGYKAKQRIVEVGALYKDKAPEGYETFAPRFFRDAYGKKVE